MNQKVRSFKGVGVRLGGSLRRDGLHAVPLGNSIVLYRVAANSLSPLVAWVLTLHVDVFV